MIDVHHSQLLASVGVVHGFSTRVGGVSEARYASLNLSAGWGDDPARVAENRRRFAAAVGYDPARLATGKQVHGTVINQAHPDELGALATREGDGLVSRVPGLALGVYTADCVPVLIAHPDSGAVAAVHAGWRGAAAGIAGLAVQAVGNLAAAPLRQLVVALGPSIGPCCFEVGQEVVDAFTARWPGAHRFATPGPRGKPHFDLWRAIALDLAEVGVKAAQLDATPPCTHCNPERFFSYRRDGRAIGQQLSVVVGGPLGQVNEPAAE